MNKRIVNGLGFACCAGLMGYALYAQHKMMLEPCPLCVFQRVAVIGLGILFFIATFHTARYWGRFAYAFLFAVIGGFGVLVAGRHVWLQSLPADQVPACGPGLGYMLDTLPLSEALSTVFKGSGECADVDWSFLGLTMPTWVLIWVVVLALTGIVNSLRRPTANAT